MQSSIQYTTTPASKNIDCTQIQYLLYKSWFSWQHLKLARRVTFNTHPIILALVVIADRKSPIAILFHVESTGRFGKISLHNIKITV